ncbi:MAG: SAM-dependent methyltransferase [Candidatus Binatia bacterium]|nr:MAG: SAM-dependent methyltransferase [Candidatus Binatia bacterium]
MESDRLRHFLFLVFGHLTGAVTSAMIHLGDRLGLYRAMRDAGAPLSAAELAQRSGLHERWLREWLRAQAAAGTVNYAGEDRFELSPEAAWVLADETSPVFAAGAFHSLPEQLGILRRLPECFRTGLGLPYDAFGPEGAAGIERFLGPWFRNFLVPLVLPSLEGVVPRLEAGAKVADIGCGAGVALVQMATAFPNSEFHGYDISRHALERAAKNIEAAGLSNVVLHCESAEALPPDHSFDLVTAFDCIHDMPRPRAVLRAVRECLKPDGVFFIADINARPSFEENLQHNPLAAMMYGISVLACLSSSLSEPGGEGLGTLGLTEPVVREMAAEAGFREVRRHDFQNPVNAYYELRP